MQNTVFHQAESRGNADHGWLHSRHTFSFADYYDPERVHFGTLRVLNDDIVDAGVCIYQNAWFHLGQFDKGFSSDYNIKAKGNGVYAFILSGDMTILNQKLKSRDGFGIWDVDKFNVKADTDAEFLLMEVPMKG